MEPRPVLELRHSKRTSTGLVTVTVADIEGCKSIASAVVSTDITDANCSDVRVHFTRFSSPTIPNIPTIQNDTLWVLNFTGTNNNTWIIDLPMEGTNGLVSVDEWTLELADINTITCDLPPYEIQIEDGADCDGMLPIDVSTIIKDQTSIPLHSCVPEPGDIGPFSETVTIDLNTLDNLISIEVFIFNIEIEYYLSCTPVSPAPTVFEGLQTSYCEGETTDVLPTTDDNGIPGTWSPAAIDNMVSGTYTFTPDCNECADTFTLDVNINLIGVACNDNNPSTFNDVYNDSCECLGTPLAQNFCTDILLNVIGSPIPDGTYDAIQTVISAGVVVNGSTVSHIAGDQVILNPGFTAESNVYFVADIIPCPVSSAQSEKNDKDKRESQD